MSADRWSVCPRCHGGDEKNLALLEEEMHAAYGKAEPEEYIRKVTAFNKLRVMPPDETLREAWYLGIFESGQFEVTYQAECVACNFAWSYSHEEYALDSA